MCVSTVYSYKSRTVHCVLSPVQVAPRTVLYSPTARVIVESVTMQSYITSGMEMDEEDSDYDDSPKLRTYKEAINNALEDVCQFLENKGHGSEALSISSSIDCIMKTHVL